MRSLVAPARLAAVAFAGEDMGAEACVLAAAVCSAVWLSVTGTGCLAAAGGAAAVGCGGGEVAAGLADTE